MSQPADNTLNNNATENQQGKSDGVVNVEAVDHHGVTLTEKAIKHTRQAIAKAQAKGMRLGLKRSGCSGYMYQIDYATEIKPTDTIITYDGDVNVVIDHNDLPLLAGLTIDYVTEGVNSQLRFINPNAHNECGCGESFAL